MTHRRDHIFVFAFAEGHRKSACDVVSLPSSSARSGIAASVRRALANSCVAGTRVDRH